MTIKDYIQAWKNDTSRRTFIQNYKSWGVWLTVPELDLTFYRYQLPNGWYIIAMTHAQKTYYPHDGEPEWHESTQFYLQKYDRFMPERTSDSAIAGELLALKQKLIEEEHK